MEHRHTHEIPDPIFIKPEHADRTIEITGLKTDSKVTDIKTQICEKEGYHISNIRLISGSQEITQSEDTLKNLGISKDSSLRLLIIDSTPDPIFIKTATNKRIILTGLATHSTVADIKSNLR